MTLLTLNAIKRHANQLVRLEPLAWDHTWQQWTCMFPPLVLPQQVGPRKLFESALLSSLATTAAFGLPIRGLPCLTCHPFGVCLASADDKVTPAPAAAPGWDDGALRACGNLGKTEAEP